MSRQADEEQFPDELFGLMAHAEDLQKVARQQQYEAEEVLQTVKKQVEKLPNVIRLETSDFLKKEVAKEIESHTREASKKILDASNTITEKIKLLIALNICIPLIMSIFYYGYLFYIKDSVLEMRKEARYLKSQITELSSKAVVERYENRYIVKVDPKSENLWNEDKTTRWVFLPDVK